MEKGQVKPLRSEETALNQHLGEFRGADLACLPAFCNWSPRCILVHLGSELEPWGNSAVSYRDHARMQIPALTSLAGPPIIRAMPRPDAVRRVKSYSAADGYVYQYYFFEGNRAQRHG